MRATLHKIPRYMKSLFAFFIFEFLVMHNSSTGQNKINKEQNGYRL